MNLIVQTSIYSYVQHIYMDLYVHIPVPTYQYVHSIYPSILSSKRYMYTRMPYIAPECVPCASLNIPVELPPMDQPKFIPSVSFWLTCYIKFFASGDPLFFQVSSVPLSNLLKNQQKISAFSLAICGAFHNQKIKKVSGFGSK